MRSGETCAAAATPGSARVPVGFAPGGKGRARPVASDERRMTISAPPRPARLPGLLPILVLFTVLSVCVGFFNALYASHTVQKERALTHALASVQSNAGKFAEAIDIYLDAIERQLDASVTAMSAARAPEQARAELARLRSQIDAADAIMLVSPAGEVLAGDEPASASLAPRLAAAAARPGAHVVEGNGPGATLLLMSRRLPADAGAQPGALVAAVRLDAGGRMDHLLSSRAAEQGLEVFLFSRDGRLLYRPAGNDVAATLEGLPAIDRPGARMVESASGAALVGYAPVAAGAWAVIARQSVQAILAPVNTLLREALMQALPMVALTLLLVGGVAYAIAVPLRRLAGILSGGRRDVRVPRAWYAEAAALGQAVRTALAQHHREVGRLNAQSQTDPLTGLSNRRALDKALEAWSRGNGGGAILALDLDHFKRVNDTYGHAAGDRVLVRVSRLIRRSVREHDQAFRVGGEEFIVLLPGASPEAAMDGAQRLRVAIAQTDIDGVGKVSISGGIALWTPGQCSAETALARADEALYASKSNGRNRITHWSGAP